jgi:prevent-host-death family protein
MDSYGIEEARTQLGDLVERVRLNGEHIAVTRYGKRAVVIVPAEWHEAMYGDLETGHLRDPEGDEIAHA